MDQEEKGLANGEGGTVKIIQPMVCGRDYSESSSSKTRMKTMHIHYSVNVKLGSGVSTGLYFLNFTYYLKKTYKIMNLKIYPSEPNIYF